MTPVPLLYPPSPAGVPANLTTPSMRYRWQVVVVLACLFLFLLLYLAMIWGAIYLFLFSLLYPVGEEPVALAWKGLALVGSGLLLVFLLRGLFRWSQTDPNLLVEVREADQPVLFAFLRRLCADLKAPLPHHVFLSPEVNAAVFSNTSILSLFLPARRNLLVGLGLVNALNLTEFKAVLAHEFGHFSQKSTRLTRYVYTANPVMADLVYRRDLLDTLVARAGVLLLQTATLDVRLFLILTVVALPVVVPLGSLWLFRLLLESLYKGINFQNLSLQRQMEFNADLFAASVTGSDAPVHVLARLLFATEALAFTRDELAGAADHGVYSRDLFYHQSRAADHLRQVLKDPHRGEPPPLPEDPSVPTRVFRPEDTDVLAMWATHPPPYEREQNLKRRYVRSTFDTRSPWLLFREPETVRARVSERFYRALGDVPGELPLADPEAVQAVIEAERAEATYAPRYRGAYDDRYLEPGDLDALAAAAAKHPWDADQLAQVQAGLFDDALARWLEEHRRRRQEYERLGTLSMRVGFEFRGRHYPAGDARRVRSEVRRELDADDRRWTELDRNVFRAHYQMGRALGPEVARDLLDRYRFHLALQEILKRLSEQHDWVGSVLHFLSGAAEVTEQQYEEIVRGALTAHQALGQCLAAANGLALPELKHVTAGRSLGEFLLGRRTIADFHLDEQALRPKRLFRSLGRLEQQLGQMRDRLRRVHFKSLGGLLALQESIASAAPGVQPGTESGAQKGH
jgi:Zn-dependent protease with chaperone function